MQLRHLFAGDLGRATKSDDKRFSLCLHLARQEHRATITALTEPVAGSQRIRSEDGEAYRCFRKHTKELEGLGRHNVHDEAIDHFDSLHEGMVFVADLVFPSTKTASGVDSLLFKEWNQLYQRLVAMQPRRGIALE